MVSFCSHVEVPQSYKYLGFHQASGALLAVDLL